MTDRCPECGINERDLREKHPDTCEHNKLVERVAYDLPWAVAEIERLRVDLLRWQPIETAPKDGTAILLYDPEARGAPWLDEDASYTSYPALVGRWDGDRQRWMLAHYDAFSYKPIHWMPLPKSP